MYGGVAVWSAPLPLCRSRASTGITVTEELYHNDIIPTMNIEYATVKAKGQIVIPVDLRRRFQIEEGTRVAFLEEEGRLFLQPVTDEFINGMQGALGGQGLPSRVERSVDRKLK